MNGQRILVAGTLSATILSVLATAYAQTAPSPVNSLSAENVLTPANARPWVRPSYLHALRSPLPAAIHPLSTPAVIPKFQVFPNRWGFSGIYQPGGPVTTANNAFFQPFGANGRSCLSCHQPSQAMSVTPHFVRAVFEATEGKDPLFAPVDGANCPNQVPAAFASGAMLGGRTGSQNHHDLRAAYSQLLNKGLFRIFLPVPKFTTGPNPLPTEFTIELLSDPNGCNADPAYSQEVDPATGEVTQIISVYRRPLITSSLKFKTTTLANFPDSGIPPTIPGTRDLLPIDPFTGEFVSLNLMWDGRDLTLHDQAVNAVLIHAQATEPPTDEQVAQMVAFQNGIFSAQEVLRSVNLSAQGGNGGSKYLSSVAPLSAIPPPPGFGFTEYDAWLDLSPTTAREELQASIARGQAVFNDPDRFRFQIGGLIGGGCAVCHGQPGGGSEPVPGGQRNTGVGGQSVASNGPAPDPTLPIFKLTCVPGARTGNDGAVVITNDPGQALITGRCADIGNFTVPQIRSLPARAPFFHDGSAATVLDIVNFYDTRFAIGYSAQEKEDLVNFMNAL